MRRLLVALLALAVVAGALSLETVRSAAGEFLDVFRVRRFQVITVTPQDMAQLDELIRRGGTAHLESFGRIEVTGEAATRTVTAAEAEEALGFPLRLPPPGAVTHYDGPQLELDVLPTVSLTLNVANVNAFLRSLGSRDLLPESLEGKTFTIKGHPVCTALYRGERGPLRVIQGRSPELTVPPGVDVAALRAALLGIPGLPENLRRQLASITDWRHTLPVPSLPGTCTQVTVNGRPGVFWAAPDTQAPDAAPPSIAREGAQPAPARQAAPPAPSTLFWEDGGVLYAIQGPLTLSQATELACSLEPR